MTTIGYKHSEETKKKISEIAKQKGFGKQNKGRKRNDLSEWNKANVKRGENHPNWKGGSLKKKCFICNKEYSVIYSRRNLSKYCSNICRKKGIDRGLTEMNKKIRMSLEYKLWRTAVFERDNFTCIWCGSKKNIEADHIKPFAYFPELRFAIDNGRTLCHECHKTTDTYMNRWYKQIFKI